jgi:hypothetical protein
MSGTVLADSRRSAWFCPLDQAPGLVEELSALVRALIYKSTV